MILNKIALRIVSFVLLTGISMYLVSCGVYSLTGGGTAGKNISITEFYNNTDLGPANMGQTFTNSLKNYLIQNSSLSIVQDEGELQLEGEITSFTMTPIAPVAGDPNQVTPASLSRLTITIKVTYVNNVPSEQEMSFKDKTFSFYTDFPNEQNLSDVQDSLIKTIFDRLIQDIFNASVANW